MKQVARADDFHMATKHKSGPSGRHVMPQLNIRYESAQQKRRWQAAAKRDGRDLSSWIRKRLDDCADRELESKKSTDGAI